MNLLKASCVASALAALPYSLAGAGGPPVGTDFTYQGRLRLGGDAVNSSADLQFRLWDAAAGGSPVSAIQQLSSARLDARD